MIGAIERAFTLGATFLRAGVQRVTRGASEDATNRVLALSHDALVATRTADDALRQYLSENGGVTDVRAPTVRDANRAVRLRAAAELIADVVPPPLGVYEQTKAVLETHAKAVSDRITGSSQESPPPISDDFVMTLRAEAPGVQTLQSDGDLAVAAALPLVTVAAHLGGLELLYPSRS